LWDPDEALCRAAQLGDGFAQSRMARRSFGEDSFAWASKSAAQGERDGFFWLGWCYENGRGCERSVAKAKENYLKIAVVFDHFDALFHLSKLFSRTDPERFVWLGKFASRYGAADHFFQAVYVQMHEFDSGTGNGKMIFTIGRCLKGQIDLVKREIFGTTDNFDSRIVVAEPALAFYTSRLQCYRKAVDAWTFVALRNNVVKDIRNLISKLIWDARDD
jgi:TPR repeat protein